VDVKYTGRHCDITPAIRKSVETGIAKIRKILGDKFDSKVILAVERHRHKAEISISARNGPLVGIAQAHDMTVAINEALEHLEKQAVKYKTRWRSKKRRQHEKWNGKSNQDGLQAVVGATESTAVAVVVHQFPRAAKATKSTSSAPTRRSRPAP
jgi:putative sigma-54 modulation protein